MRTLYDFAEFTLYSPIIGIVCSMFCMVSLFFIPIAGTKFALCTVGVWMLILFILGIISLIGKHKYGKES